MILKNFNNIPMIFRVSSKYPNIFYTYIYIRAIRLTTRKHEILSLSFVSAWKQEAQGLNFLSSSFSFFFFLFFKVKFKCKLSFRVYALRYENYMFHWVTRLKMLKFFVGLRVRNFVNATPFRSTFFKILAFLWG